MTAVPAVRTSSPARAARSRIAGFAAALMLVAALVACSGAGKPDVVPSDQMPGDAVPAVTVRVIDNRFEPSEVEVEPGQAVRWVFEGPAEHDVVAEDGSFVSELMTAGEYVHVFDEAGEWAYDCSIHPEMTGVVTVR